jgi:hypothetical protein
MATTIMWAGRALSGVDEVHLRRWVHTLRRVGNNELADDFERFLPEREDTWTVDERVEGARVAPHLSFDARVDRGDHGRAAS